MSGTLNILNIWEQGQRQHVVDRALTMLLYYSNHDREELAELSIGERDWMLLKVLISNFGNKHSGLSHCPVCNEPVEFEIPIQQLISEKKSASSDIHWEYEDYRIESHLPNSKDLAKIANCMNEESAQEILRECCFMKGFFNQDKVLLSDIPSNIIQNWEEELSERDPLAEIVLDLECEACNKAWGQVFDVVYFLWETIKTKAQEILSDVHLLAMSYGWSENEILQLSTWRRQAYLRMIEQ